MTALGGCFGSGCEWNMLTVCLAVPRLYRRDRSSAHDFAPRRSVHNLACLYSPACCTAVSEHPHKNLLPRPASTTAPACSPRCIADTAVQHALAALGRTCNADTAVPQVLRVILTHTRSFTGFRP